MDNGLSGYAVLPKGDSTQIRRQWFTRTTRFAAYAAPPPGTTLAKDPVLAPATAQDFVYNWQRLAVPATTSPYVSYLHHELSLFLNHLLSGRSSNTPYYKRADFMAKSLQVVNDEERNAWLFIHRLKHNWTAIR